MISTRDLTKRFGATNALFDLSIEIPDGGLTALVGPNGAGKSTLLRMCIGFERPTSGAITVGGVNPAFNRAKAVAQVGYVPQRPALYRDMTIEDHLRLASVLRPGFDAPHARARLADVGIDPNTRPRELSGGQQAQVTLAIALGTRAATLLLDEPLASLDPLARREFLQVVDAAVGTGDVSAVLSSHVLAEVEDVADHVLLLGAGSLLFFDGVTKSIDEHRTVEEVVVDEHTIGSFPGKRGRVFTLVTRDAGIGREPTLEEVVLGYLASDRKPRDEAEP